MLTLEYLLGTALLMALSGVPGFVAGRRARWGQSLSVLGMLAGGLWGFSCSVLVLVDGTTGAFHRNWTLPWGSFALGIDPLSAAFLLPVYLIPVLGALYGLGYWRQKGHPGNAGKLQFFYGVLPAAMVLVVLARDGVLFLIAWEIMALAAYFLVTTEDENSGAREAGWVYLVATHAGTLCLMALFVLLREVTGTFDLVPLAARMVDPSVAGALFVLAVTGFGFKAGLFPLHLWLPGAHANAPSHVSAVMSGVMLKMGVYGILRLTSLLPNGPDWWGGVLVTLGAVSGILGAAFALGQKDIKRLLAYSSIENVGIVIMGIGLALLGRSWGRPDLLLLGLAGALFHVWNHSLFKSLLFFSAGSVIHGTGLRAMDRLGGLAKAMPRTALLFGGGAVAACALPPMNGLAGEFLLYLGFFRTLVGGGGQTAPWASAAAPALALTGALALAAFVKAFGLVFLGEPRSEEARHAHAPGRTMTGTMSFLALACLAIGLLPQVLAPCLEHAVASWEPEVAASGVSLKELAPLGGLGTVGQVLALLVVLAFLARRLLAGASPLGSQGTWDCGYARPTPRIQYTSTSFSQLTVSLLGWALWPKINRPRLPEVLAPASAFSYEVPDPLLDRATIPALQFTGGILSWIRWLQQGSIQLYLIYILAITLILFLGS